MHNTHVQVDRDPDPFSFNARVNATRIAISILVGSRSRIFAPCKRGITLSVFHRSKGVGSP